MSPPTDLTAEVTEMGSATMAGRPSRRVPGDEVGLPPGTVIGRYVVEAVIGSGGMGVVFRARDQQLDRVVALKRLYPEHVRAHGESRLLREARAMAQLSHPNVVPVYGVERWQGGAVLAMELVEGRALDEWLRAPHDPHEGLQWMLAAGEGLRAAHDAGLIHRDFKPSNVLVGVDGRARVVDFGLARQGPLAHEPDGPASMPGEGLLSSRPDGDPHARLDTHTEGGRLMGTVAYMAPEQLLGLPADARSDQYAYCVSLWEVLCGGRPFHGHPLASLDAKLEGPPPWPAELRTPPRIVAAIRRGLSPRPEARWPSMAALLERLHAARRPGRAIVGWVAMTASLGLAATLGLRGEEPSTPTCTGAAERLVGAWDDDQRAAVQQALATAGEAHRRDTWPRIERRLDGWTAAWVAAHTEACEATSVHGDATEAELDARMSCLGSARNELRVVVGALVDPGAADRAVALVATLPEASRCLDPQALAVDTSAPSDRELAARVDEVREGLLGLQVSLKAGRPPAAHGELDRLVERARALDWAPLLGDALMLQAGIAWAQGDYAAAERSFVEAHALAREKGLPSLEVRAADRLVRVVGHHQARHAEGMAWAETALAAVAREPALADLEAEVLESKAVVLHDQGKYAEAAELQRRVLVLLDGRALPLGLADSVETLGNILERLGQPKEGVELHRRALALREEELGPEHVLVATSLNNLATAMMSLGDAALAIPLLERALKIRERAFGPDNPQLVSVLNNLGTALLSEHEHTAAKLHLERVLTLLEARFPEGHPHLGSVLVNLGQLDVVRGRLDEGRRYYERSLAMFERTLGPAHPKLALVHDNLGNLALREGRPRAATEHHRRALELREAALGVDHPLVTASLLHLGLSSVEAGDPRSARALEERARRAIDALHEDEPSKRAMLELLRGRVLLLEGLAPQAIAPLEQARAADLDDTEAAEVALALAQALWDGGGDRRRAEALARQAHESFHGLGDDHGAQRAEQWLARHR